MAETETIVITGASGGVGRALAREFARPGNQLGLIARQSPGLEAAREELEAAGARVLALPVDVAQAEQVEKAADRVERELGPIGIWINDAMTTVFAPLDEITPEEFKRATEVTYLGTVYGTMAALRRMRPRDRGTIVQVGSALAYRSIPLQSPYCGAKHAMVGFTQSLRTELLHNKSRVRVTMVHLPGMNTPQFSWCRSRLPRQPQPVPPIYQPEVAARAIYWAAHHPRREFYVGLPTVMAIVGNRIAPGLLDHYMARSAWGSQQTAEKIDSKERPDNLFEPVNRDFGAHGIFDSRARPRSPQAWMAEHKVPLTAALGAVALGAALLAIRPGIAPGIAARARAAW